VNPLPEVAIAPVHNSALEIEIQKRLDDLTKPPGSLGKLESFVMRYCLCKGSADAKLEKKSIHVFAADHGITAEGVSPYPKEVTVQMVLNMLNGGAAVSVMARHAAISCTVVDMGIAQTLPAHPMLIDKKVAMGTASFLTACAMSDTACLQAIEHGIALGKTLDSDIAAIGEMGIGNTSSASALYALLLQTSGSQTVGRGTGATGALLEQKQNIIDRAVQFHRSQWDHTPLDALCRVGGLEIAGMAGFILGCAQARIPVIIDGFIASAAALCASAMHPDAKEYLFFGHVSDEQFHRVALQQMQADPILQLNMRLGEGTGAVLAMQLIEQALTCYHSMATFSSAGVSNRDD